MLLVTTWRSSRYKHNVIYNNKSTQPYTTILIRFAINLTKRNALQLCDITNSKFFGLHKIISFDERICVYFSFENYHNEFL